MNRTRLAIHHDYLSAKEKASAQWAKFLLDVVLAAQIAAW
jgi:hypothetical protein